MKKHVFSKTYIGLLSFLLFMGFYTEGVAQCTCTDCRCTDSLALVAFYNATGGQTWTTKNNNGQQSPWNLQQLMTTWYGVRLNANGRVECLDLDGVNDCQWTFNRGGNNLVGILPNSLGSLTDLKQLYIAFNPNLSGSIPKTIGNLIKLENLYLEANRLNDSIPSEIGNLSTLKSLSLSANENLIGSIPNSIGQLHGLEGLYLYKNKLSGSIPSFNLPALQVVNLSNNQLNSNIPNFNTPNLQYLYLPDNLLSGSIPNFNMPNLVHLQLQGNQLTGGIPATLNNLTKLELLWLGRNPRLGGTIPRLDNLTSLKYLAFEADSLTGNMPDWLGNMTNLIEIGLSSNKLSGEIPVSIGNLKKLKILWLGSNQLAGVIPTTLGGLDSLELLTLDNNQFKGSLPESMKNLNNLWQLYISKNQFSNILQNAMLKIGQGRRSYISTLPTPKFIIDQNALTFTNILPYINRGFEFLYNPQDSIYKDTTITARVAEPLSIDLNIDATVTTNSYKWFKNGTPFRTPTNSNKLVFDKLLPTDAGVYTCQVTNSLAPLCTLYTRKITVAVALTCRYSDSLQLVSLYNATNGANWTNKWILTQPMTSWYGVTLNTEGCVIDIILNQNNLNGNLPNINIPNLIGLNLDNNQLKGSIPNLNLPNLQSLALPRNQLTTIPNFNLPNLKYLYLNTNQLTGNIPNLDSLPNLQDLYLYTNQLKGNIPNFKNSPNLQVLSLYTNQLSGSIPSFNLPNLTYLNLVDNPLIGNIPNFNLPKLQHLLIAATNITGNIPTNIGDLHQLISLHLSSNKFLTGTIPSSIGLLTSLETLGLGSNNLSDTIPNEIGNCRNLKGLFLDSNKSLKGSIPSSIGNLKRLKILWLSGNILSGKIPESIGLLDSLEDLALNTNQLTGSVPTTFNQLKVKRLLLSRNRLTGLPNLKNIPLKDSIFDVNNNHVAAGLTINNNALTFESILPNLPLVQSARFIYNLQDSIYKDTTIKIIPNTPLSISLGIDSTVTTNSYQWYKNGKEFGAVTSSNILTINALTFEHAGVYTCTVSNDKAPNLKLYSRPITLTTGRIETTKVETAISPNGDGMNDALDFPDANLEGHPENAIEIYNRWGQLIYKASPYKRDWSGQDLNGQLLPAGDYFFIMRVSIGDGQIIVGSVYLSR